jgi:hypothetical protein
VNAANANVNNNMQSQDQLLAALQRQNGLGQQNAAGVQQNTLASQLAANNGAANQGQVFGQGQTLQGQLANANGVGTQGSAISGLQNIAGQQQATANQYGAMSRGEGPNPAQAMLNQQTANNIQNQAAMMAGQRGAGSNVGMLARQAAQQGANTQQQSVGQGATMQANQMIQGMAGAAGQQQAMANTQGQIGGLGTTQVGQQQNQQQMLANQAQNQVGNQLAANAQRAGQANIVAGQQLGQTNANATTAAANAGQLMGAAGNANAANVNMQSNVNNANAGLAQTNMQGQQAMIGGMMNMAGSAMGGAAPGGAGGGMFTHHYFDGGDTEPTFSAPPPQVQTAPAPQTTPLQVAPPSAPEVALMPPQVPAPQPQGPQSDFAQFMAQRPNGSVDASAMGNSPPAATEAKGDQAQAKPQGEQDSGRQLGTPSGQGLGYGSQALKAGLTNFGAGIAAQEKAAKNAPSDAMSSVSGGSGGGGGGGAALMALAAAKGGQIVHDMRGGGKVIAKNSNEKAVKPGNDYANDKIDAKLSEGEIVVPRSVTMSKEPVRDAAAFVAAVLAKRGKKR